MGAWGPHSFDNDAAEDWRLTFEEDGLVAVRDALAAVFADPDALDSDDASQAVAASEMIAAMLDHPRAGEDAVPGLGKLLVAAPDIAGQALGALDRVRGTQSELAELWDETDEADLWRASLTDLEERLRAGAKAADMSVAFTPPFLSAEAQNRVATSQIYADMMAALEAVADRADDDPLVEMMRHFARKVDLMHKDVSTARYAVVDSIDALTDRIERLEKRLKDTHP